MRKTVFTREDVIAAGLKVMARDGLSQLSARRVADELNSSTAPVYSNFASMEELADAVKREAVAELRQTALVLFPGKADVFDLVIAPRMERVITERWGRRWGSN